MNDLKIIQLILLLGISLYLVNVSFQSVPTEPLICGDHQSSPQSMNVKLQQRISVEPLSLYKTAEIDQKVDEWYTGYIEFTIYGVYIAINIILFVILNGILFILFALILYKNRNYLLKRSKY